MANFSNSIDVTIFMSMSISKKCLELGDNRPVLFLSNPGIGKSTAVEMFCKVNNYEEVLLRISNETPDTITGYDIAATGNDSKEATSAKHIRPSWFQKILDYEKAGKRTVLFLDELTTADQYVQGAALNLVFDRRCHAEYLPKDTLIVAAGNYAQNLATEMSVLAPMLNRFMIVNITPKKSDLDHFLCKYDGAISGSRRNFFGEIEKAMTELKNQEKKDMAPNVIDAIGETFQRAILDEAKCLYQSKDLDLAVTDLKDIYSDVDNDEPVPNFISLRTLNYLLDASVACYVCFGKDGLISENFRSMVRGTVGLAISRKSGKIEKKNVTENFHSAIITVANDIEKMFDKKLPEYNKYYSEILSKGKEITKEQVTLLNNKIREMMKDPEVADIDRPIDPEMIKSISRSLVTLLDDNKYKGLTFDVKDDPNANAFKEELKKSPETFMKYVVVWNSVAEIITTLAELTVNPKKKYERQTHEVVDRLKSKAREHHRTLRSIKKIMDKVDKVYSESIPAIAIFK